MTYKSRLLKALILMTCLVFSSCIGRHTGPVSFEPSSGQGPFVLMISGRSGPVLYGKFAQRLADSGYHVLLYDGNDFPIDQPDACRAKIRKIIKDNTRLSRDFPGKVAVIGYSLGGAVALTCAASMPEEIAGIIAYYPATWLVSDYDAFVDRFRVPITVLQGEADHYFDCCTIERITGINLAAKKKDRDFDLIVYPHAGHGFNLGPMKNKELDLDSWRKTTDALKRYLP
jgi:dienelactone hydrolase